MLSMAIVLGCLVLFGNIVFAVSTIKVEDGWTLFVWLLAAQDLSLVAVWHVVAGSVGPLSLVGLVRRTGTVKEKRRTTLSMSEAAIFLGVGRTQIKGVLRRHRIARHGIPVERLFRILELRRQREARRRGQ